MTHDLWGEVREGTIYFLSWSACLQNSAVTLWGSPSQLSQRNHMRKLKWRRTDSPPNSWHQLLDVCVNEPSDDSRPQPSRPLVEASDTVHIFLFLLFFFFLVFLGLHPGHMEDPRLGLNQSSSHWPMPQPEQYGIWVASAAYTTAHGKAGSLTYWGRPGIEPESSWILARFINHWAMTGTPILSIS